ncbi:TetR/AcrR family transcriptional regulator [Streptomyces sp. NBC_01023]|uniref:TetR/AcrR family transcriptional regulator n=1 Tax=Streptomyces sp. NBC_01023 TaxID=2903724 RepID=UPI003867628A|nr:TetR/AcrR family transcriptional regulator [Streptomyces sp. NBC_01023]
MGVVTDRDGGTARTGNPDSTGRGPKQDRSRATRQRLLEAAVSCLAEHGWAGSTVSAVAERAGVSRGAAQHHFPTREDLFTAAVEYVAEERSTALRTLPPQDRRTVVAALVGLYTGPLFRAALHLWVAASNEPQLHARVTELEARVGRESHRIAVQLLRADESVPGVRETVQGLLDMARGLGLANLLTDDAERRERVVAQWGELVEGALGGRGSGRG